MELKPQRRDCRATIGLLTALLGQFHASVCDSLSADVRPEGALLRPARRKYVLDQLVAQCDPNALNDVADCGGVGSVGREVW